MRAAVRRLPGSSYVVNALSQDNCIMSPYDEYLRLGQMRLQCWEAYRALFDAELTAEEVDRVGTLRQDVPEITKNQKACIAI